MNTIEVVVKKEFNIDTLADEFFALAEKYNNNEYRICYNFLKEIRNDNDAVTSLFNKILDDYDTPELEDINWVIKNLKKDINIGDTVVITSVGNIYSTYPTWFVETNVDNFITAKYCFAQTPQDTTQKYKVVAKGKHRRDDKMLYAIEENHYNDMGKVFLIGENGITKVF